MWPDPVLIDWQMRLFNFLYKQQIELYIKEHPEFKRRLPDAYEEIAKFNKVQGIFEELSLDYDKILFDYTCTTTFGYSLKKALPVVLIDFGFSRWLPHERKAIEQTCKIIPGYFDDQNRAMTNWDALLRQLVA